ncbi:MAG TPA: peptidylprolyl isomerase [Ignavibacteria bacterium]
MDNYPNLDKYRFLRKIGEGGMGSVYLAIDIKLDRKVAIKELNLGFYNNNNFIERFYHEAKIQAKLSHPNLVSIYSFEEIGNRLYIIMEYVEGITLDILIKENKRISEKYSFDLLKQILIGLDYAHKNNVIHRDIKPNNIIINKEGIVKIMDFGISKNIGDNSMTSTGATIGTLYYMSPEQILRPRSIDQRTDLYSLGISFYQMLTGELPFNVDTDSDYIIKDSILKSSIPNPQNINGEISESAVIIINKLTQKNPDNRYQNCKECLNDIISHYNKNIFTSENKNLEENKSNYQKNQQTAISSYNQETPKSNSKSNILIDEKKIINKKIFTNKNIILFSGVFVTIIIIVIIILNVSKNDNIMINNSGSNTKSIIQKDTASNDNIQKKIEDEPANNVNIEKKVEDDFVNSNIMKLETTMGTIKIKLFPDKAPKTVQHIKALVNKKFYDGIIFHRVIDGFVIQGGDPTGIGNGGSGEAIPDEFGNGLKHNKTGIVAMANTGRPNSQDSQFYITLDATPHLDGKYTVFGEVIDGLDIVKKIGKVKTGVNDKPVEPVKMTKVTMVDK